MINKTLVLNLYPQHHRSTMEKLLALAGFETGFTMQPWLG